MRHVAGDHHFVVADPFQHLRQELFVAFAGEIDFAVFEIFRWRAQRWAGQLMAFSVKVVIHALEHVGQPIGAGFQE
jgi:hypothetical protein